MKGIHHEFFIVRDQDGRPVRRLYDKSFVDPAFGTRLQGQLRRIPLYRFSDDSVKDLLAEYYTGKIGDWTIPKRVGREYLKQLTAERREERVDPKGRVSYVWVQRRRANHILDNEKQILVAAIASRTVALAERVSAQEAITALP
jgi:hypothetical protein